MTVTQCNRVSVIAVFASRSLCLIGIDDNDALQHNTPRFCVDTRRSIPPYYSNLQVAICEGDKSLDNAPRVALRDGEVVTSTEVPHTSRILCSTIDGEELAIRFDDGTHWR